MGARRTPSVSPSLRPSFPTARCGIKEFVEFDARLREYEPGRPWDYFFESAPYMMTANNKVVHRFVNGTSAVACSF